MKKTLSALLFLVLLFSTSALADWNTYPIKELNAEISFPDSCYVFYDGMPDSNAAQTVFGTTTKQVIEFVKAQGALIYVVFDDFETEATLTYAALNPPVNLNDYSLAMLKDVGKSIAKQYEAMGAKVINSTPYEANGKKVAQVSLEIPLQSETNYRSLNMMSNGQQLIQIVFTSIDDPITAEEQELFKQICGTLNLQ